MKRNSKSRINSFIAIGFGSSDTGINLYWSDDALKTLEKYVHKQFPEDQGDQSKLPDEN